MSEVLKDAMIVGGTTLVGGLIAHMAGGSNYDDDKEYRSSKYGHDESASDASFKTLLGALAGAIVGGVICGLTAPAAPSASTPAPIVPSTGS